MILDPNDYSLFYDPIQPFKQLVDSLTNCPDKEFPARLNANLKWEKPRGNLNHWIAVLNRIDEILETQIKKYGLDQEYPRLHQISNDDQYVIVACLKFTCTLLKHCIDEMVYSSSDRIFDLIKTPTIDVRLNALEVMALIGERHVQTNHTRYSAPKAARALLLQIAKSYPPIVPPNFAYEKNQWKDKKPPVIGNQHNYLDLLLAEKPQKWRSLHFQYFKSTMEAVPIEAPVESEGDSSSKQIKHKGPKKAKLAPTEGLATFVLSEDAVRKLSIEQIFDKASEVIPEKFWFEFGLAATVTKAFNTASYESLELRKTLLQIKCLAIGCISCLCSSQFTSTKLFEAEPYIFSFLVEIIHPDHSDRVSKEVLFAATKALEFISLKKVWGNDIIRAMGGNVNHGTLFQCLRFIHRQITNPERGEYYEEIYIHLLNMIGSLITTKSLASRLTAGGIISDLMGFFNLKVKNIWTCSAVVHLTSIYLSAAPDSLDDFIAKNGFGLLIDTIKYEVGRALEEDPEPYPYNTTVNDPLTISTPLYYSISFRQANYIRNLLKLVVDLIQADLGDRLRNLFDSHLLESFNKILTNPKVFGPSILASTIDSVFYIIHNEPTAFSILNEAKVIDTILDNYASFLLPSESLLMSLPEVIGAICLNKDGLKKVIDKQTIPTYFQCLTMPELLSEIHSPTNLGCTFDELGRHYPLLRPILVQETKKLFQKAPSIFKGFNGTQFFQSKEHGALYFNKDEPIVFDEPEQKELPNDLISCNESIIIDNMTSFLEGLLQESGQWVKDIMTEIDINTWLDVFTIPELPFDFNSTRMVVTLSSSLKYFDEENRNYGFPEWVKRVKSYLSDPIIQEYMHFEDTNESFFARFVNSEDDQGSRLLRTLATLNNLFKLGLNTYASPYITFHERMVQLVEHLGDENSTFVHDMGLLLQRAIIEETVIRSNLPDEMADQTTPSQYTTHDGYITIISNHQTQPKRKFKSTSAKFKNTWQIRHANGFLVTDIARFFNTIGRVCMNRKQEFSQINYRLGATRLTLQLGETFKNALSKIFTNSDYKNSYILTLSQVILYTMTIKERTKEIIPTSLAFSFFQNQVYDLLKDIGAESWQNLLEMDPKEAEKSKELKFISPDKGSLIKNGLSHILSIFSRSVNSDFFTNFPVSKLYFHNAYEEESAVNMVILIQTKLCALELVKKVFQRSNPGLPTANYSNIPSPLLEIVNQILISSYQNKNERYEQFVPLDIRNLNPPQEQLDYLKEVGVSESDALHLFKHGLDLESPLEEWPECPSMDLDDKKWRDLFKKIQVEKIHENFGFFGFSIGLESSHVEMARQSLTDLSTLQWVHYLQWYPHIHHVFSIISSTRQSSISFSKELFEIIVDLSNKNDNGDLLNVVIQLLALLAEHPARVGDTLEKFTEWFVKTVPKWEEAISPDYVRYSLPIFEKVLVNENIPDNSISRFENHFPKFFVEPFKVSSHDKDAVFEGLISTKGLATGTSVIAITRVLILYAEDYSYASRISKSPLLKDLVRLSKSLNQEEKSSTQLLDTFRSYLIILLRRCFESLEVLEVNMANEFMNSFNASSRFKQDLHSCLKDSYSLLVRNQSVFLNVVSENVLIEGYDGTAPIPVKIEVTSNKDKTSKKEDEDVVMEDAELKEEPLENRNNFESTGVVHILLSELMKVAKTDWTSDPKDTEEKKEKEADKKKRPVDKTSELSKNTNFSYASFLLQLLAELLGSYKQSKLEFLTFSKRKSTDLKPRSTALNFFIHQLVPTQSFEHPSGPEFERRNAISSISKLCLLALVSSSVEKAPTVKKTEHVEEPDMAFIRKFFVDVVVKILKETASSSAQLANTKYGKLVDLFELCGLLISSKSRDIGVPLLNKQVTEFDQFYIGRALIDKQIPFQITSVLSELDLNFPGSEKVIKSALKPLTLLGKAKTEFQDLFEDEHQGDKDDDDIVPDEVDDREETPDLFRNSTLGMYDAEYDSEEEDEMDYFDDDPLEVLMSGEEISESDDGSSGLSDLEDDDDDDDDEDQIHHHQITLDGDDEELDSDDSDVDSSGMNDIEIIDELNLGSQDEGDSEDSDSDSDSGSDDMSENSDFYGFDEEASEYDEEELDGWIEEFEDDLDEGTNEDDNPEDRATSRSRLDPNSRQAEVFDDEDESDDNLSSVDSTSDAEGLSSGNLRRALPQFETSRTLANLLDTFLGEGNVFRGTIEFNGQEHHIDNNGASIGRAFESMFAGGVGAIGGIGGGIKNSVEPYKFLYIKSTKERWTEAMKLFYIRVKDEMISRIVPKVLSRIEHESIAVFKKKKEEAEKVSREREEKRRRVEEERKKKEEEETRKAAEEAAAAAALAAESGEANDSMQSQSTEHEPVMVRIGDREVDISGTDIDPEFFEALPDDMREEVFTQHVRERRANATSAGTDAREIDPDFLEALPEHIREEILQQEQMARRFSSIDNMRFDEDDEDEEVDEEEGGEEGGRNVEFARFLENRWARRNGLEAQAPEAESSSKTPKKPKKVFFSPLVDKQGVSALIRLLFAPLGLSQREHISHTLHYLCQSKQTRIEVMGLLIAILHDGLASQKAFEKIYAQVCTRALFGQKEGSKRLPVGSTIITIGIQIIETTNYLLERNNHLCYYLLTEHDNPFLLKKMNRKNKLKDLTKENKYPINYLLGLLEHNVIRDDQTFMDILARVLQISTRPLHVLHKVQKEDQKPPFNPPIIPEANYRHIINLLTANECSNTTFRRTISAMQNLSVLNNAQKIFSLELSDKATSLGHLIISDLNTLTRELKSSGSYNVESRSFSKFSAASSDQAKLLRILTALDYMFESKEKEKNKEENLTNIDEIEELTGLYKKLALGTLWDALSDCLRVLEERLDLTNVATALLPLIEALMVVCKHSKVRDLQIKDVVKYEAKKVDFSKEPIERLFFSFTDEHKKVLNQMVRTNPNLMSGPFGMLVRNPRVLEFDNKKNYFDRKLHQDKNENSKLAFSVRREQVFLDSYRSLFFKSKDEFKNSKLEVNFKGETGVDAGGVTREWYQVLSRQMFNPDYALFTPVASDDTTFHPNRTSFINPEHLSFFKFIGRVIGKAIHDGSFLDCHFSRAVYKRILSRPLSLKDMETLDLEYFKSLIWMLENDITDILTEDFSVETDDYGEHKIIDLIPGGRNIPVTEENKQEYVGKVVEYRLQTSVAEQMDNFLIGFHEIIPKDLVSIFDEQELELLISGLPDIDVNDWQNNSTYNNYSPSSVQIQWFWRAVKSFDNEERAKLLQFATGTSKVPLNGFKELSGANGTCKFSIHRDYGAVDRLPSSHTCFNQIDLPVYESYEELRGSLLLAITEGHEGFGLA